jgi:hypothetical protein
MHGEQEASMSCATGQAWDAEAQQCVDTSERLSMRNQ